MKRLRYLFLAGLIVVFDLVTKSMAFGYFEQKGLAEGEVEWVFGEWFGWALVRNRGVTGGMGSGLSPWIISVLTLAAVVGIFIYLLRARVLPIVVGSGVVLILGGATGNLYDRIRYEYVRDFVDVWPGLPWPSWLHHWPTFNVADAAISLGVCLLLFHAVFLGKGKRDGAGRGETG